MYLENYIVMFGDADVGTSSFTAKDSKIINNKGEIIFVTNTSTVIELENNEIINNEASQNYNAILVVLALVIGLVVVGGIVLFIVIRRKKNMLK